MTKIKICGLTNLKDALAAAELGADALGFVFAESPRQVHIATAKAIIDQLPPFITKVGVFVDEEIHRVTVTFNCCHLNAAQFHGKETPEYLSNFLVGKAIKAFRIKKAEDLESLVPYSQVADAFLLDTYVKGKLGGTGKIFNWQLALEAKKFGKPIILAGGLNPDNVVEAIKLVRPYAIDVSSGVETKPGKKDYKKMKELIENVRKFETVA